MEINVKDLNFEEVNKNDVDIVGWMGVLALTNIATIKYVEETHMSAETIKEVLTNDDIKLTKVTFDGVEVARFALTEMPDKHYPELNLENVGGMLTGWYILPNFRDSDIVFNEILRVLCDKYRNIVFFHSSQEIVIWSMNPDKPVDVLETQLVPGHDRISVLYFVETALESIGSENTMSDDDLDSAMKTHGKTNEFVGEDDIIDLTKE